MWTVECISCFDFCVLCFLLKLEEQNSHFACTFEKVLTHAVFLFVLQQKVQLVRQTLNSLKEDKSTIDQWKQRLRFDAHDGWPSCHTWGANGNEIRDLMIPVPVATRSIVLCCFVALRFSISIGSFLRLMTICFEDEVNASANQCHRTAFNYDCDATRPQYRSNLTAECPLHLWFVQGSRRCVSNAFRSCLVHALRSTRFAFLSRASEVDSARRYSSCYLLGTTRKLRWICCRLVSAPRSIRSVRFHCFQSFDCASMLCFLNRCIQHYKTGNKPANWS